MSIDKEGPRNPNTKLGGLGPDTGPRLAIIRRMSDRAERRLSDVDWEALTANRIYHPSPAAWEDEILYFLFLDRFSDGQEHGAFADLQGAPVAPNADRTRPLFNFATDAGTANRETWFDAGKTWCGGTIAGLRDKLGYLQRLGVTAVWISPVFRQVSGSDDYHGYGIQNFLDVDPHFGTREELRDFVAEAHQGGIRVILDIILNHAGNVFAYEGDHPYYYHQGRRFPAEGFRRDRDDAGTLDFGPLSEGSPMAEGVWPTEFQQPEAWARQGEIRSWDAFPEYIDGDFLSLKEIELGPALRDPSLAWDVLRQIDGHAPSQALFDLCEVYKFWIAYLDVDGYRVDTVKHMEPGAVRLFANVIHEFAQSLGKENFYLIGEITGGRSHAVNILNTTGIDAALGINDIPDKLEFLAKGYRSPGHPGTDEQEGYFDLFRNSLLERKETHQWFGRHVVTMFDDHDQVGTQHKFRFCGRQDGYRHLLAALGLNLTTMGIPCIYYGSEQAFDGADHREDDDSYSDVFLRECMFGGPFGSLQSTDKHFFDEQHEVYGFIQSLAALRREHIALRRGRQYLREVSATGLEGDFHYPQPIGGELRWVVAWSRVFANAEYLCAMNTDADREVTVYATVDNRLNPPGAEMQCLLSTDSGQAGGRTPVEARNGSALKINLSAGGFAVYALS